MKYVSLHHHSTYSYMDGFGLPAEHVERAAELGMGALALTEHGNISSHVKLEQAALAAGIKPIFGVEAYCAPADMRETQNQRKWHLTILAMDQTGYHNLNRIVTRSWDEGFYRWPTVSGGMLREHHEGLIVLSGCSDSKLACDLLGGKGRARGSERDARRTIERYKDLLGDRFYLECQQFPELPRTREINSWYSTASRRFGVPLVATSDCHYPKPEDNEMQKILHAAGRNIGSVAAAEADWEYGILLTLPTSDAQIASRLEASGLSKRESWSALETTAEIASRCNVTLPKMERVRYPLEQEKAYHTGMSSLDMIRLWLNRGWKYRGFDSLPAKIRREYIDRVKYELDLIVSKDYVDYFLMLSDAVRNAKNAGIPVGPARGSAAASLLCYLLRITEINPMPFPMMLFERFIDVTRYDLPDVDLDFDDERRDEVRKHLMRRYGEDRVGNIGTFTRYRGKNALDDVARVYQVPKFQVEQVKSFLVERSGGDSRFDASIGDTVDMFPQAREVFDKYPVLEHAITLEGNLKGMGVHAAGLVVGAEPLWKVVGAYSRVVNGNKLSVMSVDKYDGEYLGLLKIDALGLTTMGMIRIALEEIGMRLEELYDIPLDDPKTLEAFRIADVVGIFQFEGRTTRMVCQEVEPSSFLELCDINALSRPGPLHSGSTGDYIAAKHGRKAVEHIHPIVDELTHYTQYQIIYQEQILALCRRMGQFPWTHASTIRKVISQKKGEAAFNALYQEFLAGATSQDIPKATADKTWKRLVTAGTYAFNAAHCVSYSTLAWWCQWLKQHHPLAFYAASLRKTDPNKTDRVLGLMRDAQDSRYGRDIQFTPPHPKTSGRTWRVEGGKVLAGFEQIRGVGAKTANSILEFRDESGIEEWDDLVKVRGIGPKTVERIVEFVEKPDPFGVNWLRDSYNAVVSFIQEARQKGVQVPVPDTLSEEVPYEAIRSEHVLLGVVKARNLQDLFENHRSRTGEELKESDVKRPDLKDSMTLYCEDHAGLFTARINRWKYPELRDVIWGLELGKHLVLMHVVKNAFYGKTVSVQNMWVFDPEEEEEDA